ncbi:MAG TPA: hypothetical protein VLT87_25740 [Thermoanaerobaculia bacterium]|nr:hypothetical protein [Thermoanaerobaculia bacterium]
MPEENLETMLAYLREHSGRYSLEALRGQLLAAGHSPEAADRAIAEFRLESPPLERPAWRLALLVAAVDLALLGIVFLVSISLENLPDFAIATVLFSLPTLCLAELVGGAVLLAFPAKRRLGKGLLFGGLLFVGVTILAVGGFCLFIFSLDL